MAELCSADARYHPLYSYINCIDAYHTSHWLQPWLSPLGVAAQSTSSGAKTPCLVHTRLSTTCQVLIFHDVPYAAPGRGGTSVNMVGFILAFFFLQSGFLFSHNFWTQEGVWEGWVTGIERLRFGEPGKCLALSFHLLSFPASRSQPRVGGKEARHDTYRTIILEWRDGQSGDLARKQLREFGQSHLFVWPVLHNRRQLGR